MPELVEYPGRNPSRAILSKVECQATVAGKGPYGSCRRVRSAVTPGPFATRNTAGVDKLSSLLTLDDETREDKSSSPQQSHEQRAMVTCNRGMAQPGEL